MVAASKECPPAKARRKRNPGGKRGRPKKVFSDDPAEDAWKHQPQPSHEFTDFALFDSDGNIIPERLAVHERLAQADSCKKYEVCKEQCPDTGRWHGQGRILWLAAKRWELAVKAFPQCHLQVTILKHDWSYFRKLDSVTIIAVDHRHQGKRVVFKDQIKVIEDGGSLHDCRELEGSNDQSLRSAEKWLTYWEPSRPTAERHVEFVTDLSDIPNDDKKVYELSNPKFWDGYDAHPEVFLDQAYLRLSIPELVKFCGPRPFRVGRGRQARYDTVYLYGLSPDEKAAIRKLVPCWSPVSRPRSRAPSYFDAYESMRRK